MPIKRCSCDMIWPLKYGKRSIGTGNDSRQRTDDRGLKTENRGQMTDDRAEMREDSEQITYIDEKKGL